MHFERKSSTGANKYCNIPPEDSGNNSDKKSSNEDDVIKNASSLGKGILKELGELVVHHSHDNSNGTNLQPLPSKANLLSLNLGGKKQKTSTQEKSESTPIDPFDKEASPNMPAKRKFFESHEAVGTFKTFPKQRKGRPRNFLFCSSSSSDEEFTEDKPSLERNRITIEFSLQTKLNLEKRLLFLQKLFN